MRVTLGALILTVSCAIPAQAADKCESRLSAKPLNEQSACLQWISPGLAETSKVTVSPTLPDKGRVVTILPQPYQMPVGHIEVADKASDDAATTE